MSDLLDIQSNRYSTLFQLTLSASKNTSLIILNNTTLGMSFEEMEKLLVWFQFFNEDGDDDSDSDNRGRQVILVNRSRSIVKPAFKIKGLQIVCANNNNISCQNFSRL